MADCVDDDTVAACRALWLSDNANLPALVTEPPKTGRLKSPQSSTYAVITSEFMERRPTGTAGTWHDYRKVTVRVYGVRADVVKAIGFIGDLFNLDLGKAGKPTLAYAGTDQASKLARFIQWWPLDGGKVEQDPDTKDGNDIWIGTISGKVWSVRLK